MENIGITFCDTSKPNDCICKYTSIKYIDSTLKYGIYAGRIEDLNDPYESKDILNFDEYRICSLTRTKNANLMWAHYANSHKGCSIQIKYDNYGTCNSDLKRVNYKNHYINRRNLISASEVIISLYCKDDKWKDELEVRAVFYKYRFDSEVWNVLPDNQVYFRARIRAINFGCMTDVDSEDYYKAVFAIYKYNQSVEEEDRIKIQKMMMKDNEYRFVVSKNYSFEKEVERLGIVERLVTAC